MLEVQCSNDSLLNYLTVNSTIGDLKIGKSAIKWSVVLKWKQQLKKDEIWRKEAISGKFEIVRERERVKERK